MPSENGWNPAKASPNECEWIRVPGAEHVSLQFLKGQPLVILRAFAADYHAYIEPLRDADSAAWTPTNSVPTSNHLNGTAMDLNWQGADGKTFRLGIPKERAYPGNKAHELDQLLAFYEDTVYCGGYWSIKDWMHFQMGYNTAGNNRTADFIRRKIRSDGFSTYRRDGGAIPPAVGGDLVEILADAMGRVVSRERYAQLLPAVQQALAECDCRSVERISMWMAQIGHESAGLRYMEEIASGAAYEGRSDLGNTNAGDGVRFKGRGPIQITGRFNYTKLSQWAHSKNLVPSPTFFVDNPAQLSSDQYGFLGVIWYWTVARPQINSMADRNDLDGVTRAINGGLNGIGDRRNRWTHAKSMGSKLLQLTTQAPISEDDFMSALSPDEQRALYNEIMRQRSSKSPLRRAGERTIGNAQDIQGNVDGSVHVLVVDLLARLGDPHTLALLNEVANINLSQYPDRKGGRDMARAILENARRAAGGVTPVVQQVIAAEPAPAPAPAPTVTYPLPQAPVSVPQVSGAGLYNEVNNFRALLQEMTNSLSQTVKGE